MGCAASTSPPATAPVAASSNDTNTAQADGPDPDDPASLCELGFQYDMGIGVTKSPQKAAELFQRASAKGNAEATYNLAVLHAEGRGVPEDTAKAKELFEKAADAGLAEAQVTLGYCYQQGEGVEADSEKALKMYELAAKQEDVEGMYNLAGMLEETNHERALELYHKLEKMYDTQKSQDAQQTKGGRRPTLSNAGLAGHEQAMGGAMLALGVCYAQGNGVEKDAARAATLYRKGANYGNGVARFNLGVMTLYGEGGLEQDTQRAEALFKLAASEGVQEAATALEKLQENFPEVEGE